ncbi:hypothetical protein LINPERHAP1_LOCUS18075 [Linum perenne]
MRMVREITCAGHSTIRDVITRHFSLS